MMNTKSANYGNANFSTISSTLWIESIQIPTSVDYLPYPPTVEDFYETFKIVGTETYDNAIRIKKDGYLNIKLKALINTVGDSVDIQVYKLNDLNVAVRHNIKSTGYAEINFESEVLKDDEIAVAMIAETVGANLTYVPGNGLMVANEAYIMNLHFVENNDEIGNMFYSIDPNIEDLGYAIKLDTARDLVKASYPILYSKIEDTPFMESQTATNFTIVDFTQNPYLRAGASTAIVAQNLPDPQITSSSAPTDVPENPSSGEFSFRPMGGGTGVLLADQATGCFSKYSRTDIAVLDSYVQESGTEGEPDTVTFTFPELTVSNITGNSSYTTTDPNVKPNSSQMSLYMYCDKQIILVKK